MSSILKVQGPNTQVTESHLISKYEYKNNLVEQSGETYIVKPQTTLYEFQTDIRVPKLGIMLVGLGGNNGTTVTAGILANKHKISWQTKNGVKTPNYYGSLLQSSTTKIGVQGAKEVFLPLKDLLPSVNPNEVVLGGWDISKMNLAEAMKRAQVLDFDLQQQLYDQMKDIVPLPSIYYKDFIAANQEDRADNIIPGDDKQFHLETVRQHIRDFKQDNKLDKVIVLWTANTERFCVVQEGIHDTTENLLNAIKNSHPEVSPSTVFATATILEGCSFINGSPQNTLVPGVIELAKQQKVFVVGDDFKSGQTKYKTALTDYLVSAGIKPLSIVSYNHLGNNDGKNLSSDAQFKSKEKSKSNCVDDILSSNQVLYPESIEIDHTIVIKYCPTTGDSKKAMDEYISEIFMGGWNTITSYNVCEDSLLAAPLILDLILITELFERIQWKTSEMPSFERFHSVLSTLGYLCKAPLTAKHMPLVNSLYRQRNGIENILKACAGLSIDDNTLLEFKCFQE